MLYINIKRVMRLRGVPSSYKMLLEIGFAPATARRFLKNEGSRIDFGYLEKLCLALNCTPNDLLEWKPPETMTTAGEQALNKLKRDGKEDISKLLRSLPMEKFERVADIMQELKDE